MCRNIRQLHNFDPPATREEIDAACLQFVRKVAGGAPSKRNEEAYERAVTDIAAVVDRLLGERETGRTTREPGAAAAETDGETR